VQLRLAATVFSVGDGFWSGAVGAGAWLGTKMFKSWTVGRLRKKWPGFGAQTTRAIDLDTPRLVGEKVFFGPTDRAGPLGVALGGALGVHKFPIYFGVFPI